MKRIENALRMRGTGEEEIQSLIKELKESVSNIDMTQGALGGLMDLEDALHDVGLEPDYVDELIHCII